jgi:sec-independent protein translocase protein TatA
MLFGSDKIPDIARTMGKAMAQLKNATNDIKSEIQKGAEANGLDSKSITDITGNINQEISKAKENLLKEVSPVVENVENDIEKGHGFVLSPHFATSVRSPLLTEV